MWRWWSFVSVLQVWCNSVVILEWQIDSGRPSERGLIVKWCCWQTAVTFGSFCLQSARHIQCLPQVSNSVNMHGLQWRKARPIALITFELSKPIIFEIIIFKALLVGHVKSYLIHKRSIKQSLYNSKREAQSLKLLSTSPSPIPCHQRIPSKPASFLL